MPQPPFVRLWPLRPLSGDTNNIEYTGGDAKPGFEITVEISRETIKRLGRRYTPFGREVIADTHVTKRKFYCPLPSDLDITRAWNPDASPDDPSWLQISADLTAAGHTSGALRTLTAPEILRLLRAVVDENRASDDGKGLRHPFRHVFGSLGTAIAELIDLDAEAERTGRGGPAAIQRLCKRVEAAVTKAHAAIESSDARLVLRHAHAAFLAAANAVGWRGPKKSGERTTSELLTTASQARGQLMIWFEEPLRRPPKSAEPVEKDALDSLSERLEQFVRSRDAAERTMLRSSVLELRGPAELICANWGNPGDVSAAFSELETALIEVDDQSEVGRLTRVGPIHSQIACWRELRNGIVRLRELAKSDSVPINVFLAYSTAALNLAENVGQWFPDRVPGSDGLLTERDRRILDDGWVNPVEQGLLADEISPRVVRDVRSGLVARAVSQARSLGESKEALPKLERVQKALDRLAAVLRRGISGGIFADPAGQELAAAITDATPLLVAKPGDKDRDGNAVPPPIAERPAQNPKGRVKREVAIPLIRDHLLRHPTATVTEVSDAVGCSTGFVSETDVWKFNRKRLRIANRMGVSPKAIQLNEKWLSDADGPAGSRSALDTLIDKIDRDENTIFEAIGRFQQENPGSTAQQAAQAVGCSIQTVNRRQEILDQLVAEQSQEASQGQDEIEGRRDSRRKRPPVV